MGELWQDDVVRVTVDNTDTVSAAPLRAPMAALVRQNADGSWTYTANAASDVVKALVPVGIRGFLNLSAGE